MNEQPKLQANKQFNKDEQLAIYDIIFHRRDVRQFRSDPIANDALHRIVSAAHAAPSVGYMQPWNFLIITDKNIRTKISQHVQKQNAIAATPYSGKKRTLYQSLKLEGILESPLNIAVTYDPHRGGPNVLGRFTMPETGQFSVCCAIQNLWLAARAENIGVGWVSILEPEYMKSLLGIPPPVQLIAYLCVGYPKTFFSKPELADKGWRQKVELNEICFANEWNRKFTQEENHETE